ncbi:protein translocase subunit SecA [Clostridia bacterium]|nr:protein translocase subunit SecA [Clostridia bacterium]
MGLIPQLFYTYSEKELKTISPIVDEIESMRTEMMQCTDKQLKDKTSNWKSLLKKGENSDSYLVEAFAVVREASRRVLGMEHYRVQLAGGIVLYQGRIAQMKTGEGKTLVAALPAYVYALSGEGVHIVTVNDYLAKRDAELMKNLYEFLGLSVGVVVGGLSKPERRAAYACDITYVTNHELVFDYLRDHIVMDVKKIVLRGLNYALIDEADSILIDRARSPLVIAGKNENSVYGLDKEEQNKLYKSCDFLVRHLRQGTKGPKLTKLDKLVEEEIIEEGDFIVDGQTASLTDQGFRKVEQFFYLDQLEEAERLNVFYHVRAALRAHYIMRRDRDYIVQEQKVILVDSATGRITPSKRYSEGLHEAIEVKEKIEAKEENRALSSISFQNFFNQFKQKSGMTGTAAQAEMELRQIYALDVVDIPTNKKILRIDHPDLIYKTKKEKYQAIIEDIAKTHSTGQPILVGTTHIDTSELLSDLLRKKGIAHQVLNAKQNKQEASIIAKAGRYGAVTIATNMAGRGTDIQLDEQSRSAGGLKVIGVQRHESLRIDDQLRGRSGRQGDPGESRFYLSLEDHLLTQYGVQSLLSVFHALKGEENKPIQHKLLLKFVQDAQKRVGQSHYVSRMKCFQYDQILNEQRDLMNKERRYILYAQDLEEVREKMFAKWIDDVAQECIDDEKNSSRWDWRKLKHRILSVLPLDVEIFQKDEMKEQCPNKKAFKDYFTLQAQILWKNQQESTQNEEQLQEKERRIYLQTIDKNWREYMEGLRVLQRGRGWQSYGKKGNPLVKYKIRAYQLFHQIMGNVTEESLRLVYQETRKDG